MTNCSSAAMASRMRTSIGLSVVRTYLVRCGRLSQVLAFRGPDLAAEQWDSEGEWERGGLDQARHMGLNSDGASVSAPRRSCGVPARRLPRETRSSDKRSATA